jgi:hypothetical protein
VPKLDTDKTKEASKNPKTKVEPLLQSNSARDNVSEKQQTLYSSASAPSSPRVLRAYNPPEKTYDELIKELNELLEESKILPRPKEGETHEAKEIRDQTRRAFRTKFNNVYLEATAKVRSNINEKTRKTQQDELEILERNIIKNIQISRLKPTPQKAGISFNNWTGGKKTKRTRPKQPIHTSRRCQRKIKHNNKTKHKKPQPTNKTKNRRI